MESACGCSHITRKANFTSNKIKDINTQFSDMLPMMVMSKRGRSIGSIHRLQTHWRKLSKHKWEELESTFQRVLEDHQTMVIRSQDITKAHHVLTQTWKDGCEHEMLLYENIVR